MFAVCVGVLGAIGLGLRVAVCDGADADGCGLAGWLLGGWLLPVAGWLVALLGYRYH